MNDKTVRLYDEKPYAANFESEIIDVISEKYKKAVILKETLFFPEEGGQSPDKGVISVVRTDEEEAYNIEVIDVQMNGGVIYHYIEQESDVHAGDYVRGSIDFDYRFSNMQNHSGEHIFSGLAKKYFGLVNVGFHLSDTEVTFDYDKPLTAEEIYFLEKEVNKVIYENHKIFAYYPNEDELLKLDYRSKKEIDEAVRLVEIEDVDLCACCAPHVRRTGEIGICKVVDFINYKGGVRISILCGSRALEYFNKLDCVTKDISHNLSSSIDELSMNVRRINDSLKETEYKLISSNMRYLDLIYDRIVEIIDNSKVLDNNISDNSDYIITDRLIMLSLKDIDNKSMRDMVNKFKSRYTDRLIGVMEETDKGYFFIVGSVKYDCSKVASIMREEFDAKGGGSEEMIQGNLPSRVKREDIIKTFDKL